jgi:hypothetical protein
MPQAPRPIAEQHAEAIMTAPTIQPDAEQVEALRAKSLLELAGVHLRQALAFPDEIRMLRGEVASLLFENAALRYQLDQLAGRMEWLERQAGVPR